MSMAMVLEYTAVWFREKYSWTPQQCAVVHDCEPPAEAGQFFIGIDEAGVEPGPDNTDALTEIFTITVGIWRRPGYLGQRDRRGFMKLPDDMYVQGAYTLSDLERKVIIHKSTLHAAEQNKDGLHNNWAFRTAINAAYNLPDLALGAEFTGCFHYKGRGRMEPLVVDEGNTAQAWMGYRLRFRGLERIQKHRLAVDAIG